MLVPRESERTLLVSTGRTRDEAGNEDAELTSTLLLPLPYSLSIPYSPPSREFLSHEVMAQRVSQLGYMLYFDEGRATKEIEANVSPSLVHHAHLSFCPLVFFELTFSRRFVSHSYPCSSTPSSRPGLLQSRTRTGRRSED